MDLDPNKLDAYNLTLEQIDLLETLQKVDIGLLVSVPDYHERKRYLEWYTAKIKKED